jgi:hypothetical protein
MQPEYGGTEDEGGSTMQADDPLGMIRFGIMHVAQTMIMYCADPGCGVTWRVGINPMDTLPMINERALDHIAQVHAVSRETTRRCINGVAGWECPDA